MALMPLGDGVWITMIRDGLIRLLEARSLFAHVEVLVTNLVSDPEGTKGSLEIHKCRPLISFVRTMREAPARVKTLLTSC